MPDNNVNINLTQTGADAVATALKRVEEATRKAEAAERAANDTRRKTQELLRQSSQAAARVGVTDPRDAERAALTASRRTLATERAEAAKTVGTQTYAGGSSTAAKAAEEERAAARELAAAARELKAAAVEERKAKAEAAREDKKRQADTERAWKTANQEDAKARGEHRTSRDLSAAAAEAQGLTKGGKLGGKIGGKIGGEIGNLAMAAAKYGPQIMEGYSAASQNPYASAEGRFESTLRSVPVLGDQVDRARVLSGRARSIEEIGEVGARKMASQEAEAGIRSAQYRYDVAASQRTTRAEAYAGYGVVGTPTGDRSTVAGERQYQQQAAIQPALQAQEKARVERVAADKFVVESASRAKELEDQRLAAVKKRQGVESEIAKDQTKQNERGMFAGLLDYAQGGPGSNEEKRKARENALRWALHEEGELTGRTVQANEQHAAAKGAQAERQHAEALAGAGVTRAGAEILESRYQESESQSQRLGSLGPGGRLQAAAALRVINQVGPEGAAYLPPELLQAAASVAPKTVANLQKGIGDRFRVEFEELAPGEFEDERGKLRKQAGDAKAAAAGQEAAADKNLAVDVAAAAAPIAAAIKALGDTISAELAKVDQKIREGAQRR